MNVAVFSTKPYDRKYFEAANEAFGHELTFFEPRLTRATAPLAEGFDCVCVFVNDEIDAHVLLQLQRGDAELIALRSAGFNHVDLEAAQQLGFKVVRVPAYSPYAVAEHAIALLMALNRKTHRAYNRVREGNFSLDGLLGYDIYGLTVGIVGTGKIGEATSRIFHGFGCRLLGYDIAPNATCKEMGMRYIELDELFQESDIISLHCPLTPDTHHLINAASISRMKRGVTILNTSRGALIDAQAVLVGLKSGQIGHLGLDVYEEEADLFFEDLSDQIIQDDVFARLLTLPNVVITGHQGFFTEKALANIAETTLRNIHDIEITGASENEITAAAAKGS
ncbi:MAG: 2-hydroxyacid dehydrogenase [Chloroflexota bacterium]|nr:MAG: 2-hydroxyacid dehydrogenase [Chloroflexota bacterium]